MKYLLCMVGWLTLLSLAAGCSATDGAADSTAADSAATVPVMATTDVAMLISDSGVIKYHVTSPLWLRFAQSPTVSEDYQYFPDGIRLDQWDTLGQTIGTIVADTAYNYERQQLWHLIGHVDIQTQQAERFLTNDLYWDMKQHKLYSDSFIHIERPDMVLEGYGFTSNDNFTDYTIRQSSGVFPLRDEQTASR